MRYVALLLALPLFTSGCEVLMDPVVQPRIVCALVRFMDPTISSCNTPAAAGAAMIRVVNTSATAVTFTLNGMPAGQMGANSQMTGQVPAGRNHVVATTADGRQVACPHTTFAAGQTYDWTL